MSIYLFIAFLIIIKCFEKNTTSNYKERKLESEDYSNIRLKIYADCLFQSFQSNPDLPLLNQSIIKAQKTLEQLIKVRRIEESIYLPSIGLPGDLGAKFGSDCIGNLNVGVDADLIIFMRVYTSADGNADFAESEVIKYVDGNPDKRPLVGTIAFKYNLYDFNDNYDDIKVQIMSTIFLHEFTHILGFNKTVLQKKHLIYEKPTTMRLNDNTIAKLFVNATDTLKIARKYFGCDSLTGIELDNINGVEAKDRSSIHWSGRLFMGEYMTAKMYYPEQAISEITLALLEEIDDWYKVNYYTGGLMRFGKHKGCNFFTQDCIEESRNFDNERAVKSLYANEFCSSLYEDYLTFGTCSSGRQSMDYCSNLNTHALIKRVYTTYTRINFTTDNLGFGQDEVYEFCPISDSDNNKIGFGNCNFGNGRHGKDLTSIFEEYGGESFCAFSSLVNRNLNRPHIKGLIRPTCYKMSCSEKSLTIHIDGEFIVCPRTGGVIKIDSSNSTYIGYLFCPDYNLICTATEVCNNLFECVEKKSTVKYSNFEYDYQVNGNVSIEITSISDTDSSVTNNLISNDLVELGEDGVCPKNCQQCRANKQCTICGPTFIYYIGVKENDNEQIKCSDIKPTEGYYCKDKDKSGKEYYCYKCLENCIKCSNASTCEQCYPTHYINSSDGTCTYRIPGCIDYDKKTKPDPENGGGQTYYECLSCNNTDDYYCLDNVKTECVKKLGLNISLYYPLENLIYPCIRKCEDEYIKCESCNSLTCTVCNQTNHFINKRGNCVQNITNCEIHNEDNNNPECLHCFENNNYYCIKEDRTQCQEISPADYISYYKIENNEYSCVQLCNETFNSSCLECNNTHCTKCKEGYFIFEGRCLLNMTGCIDNKVINPVTKQLSCDECDQNSSYYCLNEDKSVCNFMQEDNISEYYLLPNINYSCYSHCQNVIDNCIQCNSTNCFKCIPGLAVNRKKTFCAVPPESFREDIECNIIINNYNGTLDENINAETFFKQLVQNYLANLNHISKVEHFIGDGFTITLYINPNCTEGLLNEGYFKIDTNEINKTFIEESDLDFLYHLVGIYVNYNFRSHLRFYDIEGGFMDPVDNCKTCLEKSYVMTHNIYIILKDIIGNELTKLALEKDLDIFNENADIYTDSCTNLTVDDIDIPIHLRKDLLYLHEYFEPLMCRDIDCTFIEYNFTKKTSTCQCKMNIHFEDIFQGKKIEFVPYKSNMEAKGVSEAVKVIKCLNKGIKWGKFKYNTAAIICLIVFILQVIFYVAYGCFGKPIDNIPEAPQVVANPPKSDKRTKIYLFSDWNTNFPSKSKDLNISEEEKVIQPRDDSGDQIMEEEKSLNNDIISDISIDTNAGGLFQEKKTNRNLKAVEKNKKVLILLGNKTKKKVSLEHSINNQDIISDSDETPLGKSKRDEIKGFCRNYWYFLSIKQHLINFFADITLCHMTETYIPITLKFVRSLFIVNLSLILSILWLDQKYFEKKWNHFNEKYSFTNKEENGDIEISLSERISYALYKTIAYVIVDLIILIFADFIIGVVFFSLRKEVTVIIEKSKLSKLQDMVLIARRNFNIFYFINFILIVVFFLELCGFGATYPGGVVDCVTSAIIALLLFEIIPFIWSLILALFRHFGQKKKNKCMISFSEFFLY